MKKILLSLLIGFVGIISFCSAEEYIFNANNLPSSITFENPINDYLFEFSGINRPYGTCKVGLRTTGGAGPLCYYSISDSGTGETCSSYSPSSDSGPSVYGPFKIEGFYGGCLNYNPDWSLTLSLPTPSCPEVNTGEILSGYILESSIDSNYCVSNDLCPVYENNSLLYINNIEHQSAPVIDINIPLEYDWDTSIDSGTFFLSISGNNVDYDYIDGIITAQTVKPNSSDLNKIISELIPLFVPGLVVILFIRFVFRFIKKIF